jgi:hypothetical protein
VLSAESYLHSNDMWNTAIGALIALVTAVLGAVVALYVAKTRRLLRWVEVANDSILPGNVGGTVAVVSNGLHLPEPRLIQLAIKNTSRHDVQSADFVSQGESLSFDFGTPIVAISSVTTTPAAAPIPSLTIDGTIVNVEPTLIQPGQTIRISALANGTERSMRCTRHHLLNVQVRKAADLNALTSFWRRYNLSFIATICFAGLFFLFFAKTTPLSEYGTAPYKFGYCTIQTGPEKIELWTTRDICRKLKAGSTPSDAKNSSTPKSGAEGKN